MFETVQLGWEAWLTLAVILVMVATLARDAARPDLVLLGSLGLLLVTGVVSPAEAFAGFSNSAVLAVGALLAVVPQRRNAIAFS